MLPLWFIAKCSSSNFLTFFVGPGLQAHFNFSFQHAIRCPACDLKRTEWLLLKYPITNFLPIYTDLLVSYTYRSRWWKVRYDANYPTNVWQLLISRKDTFVKAVGNMYLSPTVLDVSALTTLVWTCLVFSRWNLLAVERFCLRSELKNIS